MADKPVRADKATAVAELTENFRSSTATVLTEYRGLTVAQLNDAAALARHARPPTRSRRTRWPSGPRPTLASPVSTSCSPVLPRSPSSPAMSVEAAKGLRDFAKANPQLVIKGGVFEGKPISAAEVTKLADLESREVLLAKLAGAMKANLSKAAALFQAPLSKAARLVGRPAGQARDRTGSAERGREAD